MVFKGVVNKNEGDYSKSPSHYINREKSPILDTYPTS